MFYHPDTEGEIVSLRNYLKERRLEEREDALDKWIRMVATNRLTATLEVSFLFIPYPRTRR
jgi:hypothetical protein